MIRTCSSCGKKNRIPAAHLADTGTCGSCSTPLGPTAEPIDVRSVAEFDQIVANAKVPILVDFWAEWCGSCRKAAPEVKMTAATVAGQGVVLKIDTMRLPDLASRYGVQSISNFALFRSGKLAFQQAGLVRSDAMVKWIRQAA
ncbi:MAG: thioredoxin 2 [Bradymonadia bacterium]|jgi:thioredoxin 2